MPQQDVLFAVHGTHLELVSCEQEMTAGSVYADRFVFTFDERWDDYAGRVALFGLESKRMTPIILSRNEQTYSCVVPPEILQKLNDGGNLYLSVWGVQNGTEAVLKTKVSTIHISESGSARLFLTPAEQNDFIESAERYLAAVEAYAASIKEIEAVKMENDHLIITFNDGSETDLGNVKGTKGDKGDKGDTGATGAQGPRGVGISNIIMTADGDLTIYTSDSSAYPVGHVKGDTGATGAKGDKGDKGDTGEPGTTDYTDLTNKPQLNGNTLTGNKTSAQLGMQSELVSGTNIKTINGENVLGSGNIDVPVYSYEVEVEFNQSGDIFLQQSDIDYLYANQPQMLIVNLTQGGTLAARQIYTLIGKNDIVGIKNGLLNYVLINDFDEIENLFNFIQIPTSSTSKLIIREVTYQEKLTFDSTPTARSANPVTSAGIKAYVDTAVGNIEDVFGELISGGGVE